MSVPVCHSCLSVLYKLWRQIENRLVPMRIKKEFWSSLNLMEAMMASIRWSRMETMHIIGSGLRSPSRQSKCFELMTILAFIHRWEVSTACTRMGVSPWYTAVATKTRSCPTLRRWVSGTLACPLLEKSWDGLGEQLTH